MNEDLDEVKLKPVKTRFTAPRDKGYDVLLMAKDTSPKTKL